MNDRQIPHDLDAETALLGSMMLSRDAHTAAVLAGVTPGDFYKPAHASLYRAMNSILEQGAFPDPVTIAASLNGHLEPLGGQAGLTAIQIATPASANAHAYARIIRDHARRRELIIIAGEVEAAAYEGNDAGQVAARLTIATAPSDNRSRTSSGGTFTLDVPDSIPAVWGKDDRVLWAQGEGLLLVGPPGVGKTTIAAQLVAARIGLQDHVLDLPVTRAGRVLYMACDRPSQIQRAFNRLFGTAERELLDERLVIWKGPPPRDLGRHPETLLALARDHGADCVFIDSLKDVAIGISDDEIGAGLNSAIQHALAENIDVCALHHQRKGKDGSKPKTLEDVYGSIWIAAGAGSIVLLWGQAGDPLVELVHLKQPAAEVGPLQIDHDHNTGITTMFRGDVDPLRVLRHAPGGLASTELATLTTGKQKPSDNERRKAKRTLDSLVARHLAHVVRGHVGAEGASPDRYFATTPEPEPALLEEPF